jgi:N-acetylmuramic acid 6-phosphate etherase
MRMKAPETEAISPLSRGLDRLPVFDLVQLLAAEHTVGVAAVASQLDVIARLVDEIVARLSRGGRLHYIGAGTSGRLAFLDAGEIPPTFGVDPSLVCAHIAGGVQALTRAIEGAEDDASAGQRELEGHVKTDDAVIALSASGGAAYVVAAAQASRAAGAFTVAVVGDIETALGDAAEVTVVLRTGAEALAGSTRLKAGTAQKVLLNVISTAVMVRLGKVYDNLMVDVVATNAKLRDRALRLVKQLAGADDERAQRLLKEAAGSVKVAVVMARRHCDAGSARALLEQTGGALRTTLELKE